MKTSHIAILGLIFSLNLMIYVETSSAKIYDYKQLQSKDYDDMMALVRSQIKESKKSADADDDSAALFHLKEGLRMIMSRPNTDNLIPKLLPELRKELSQLDAYDKQIVELIDESIDRIQDDKNSVTNRTSALFMLENVMAEIKPELKTNEKYKISYEKIRDAQLKVPGEVKADRKVRGMFQTESPSEKAKKILEEIFKTQTK